MDIKKITDKFFVSGQVKPSDLKEIKHAGFEVVINNRPDGEASGQPKSETLAKKASELGLEYHYIPVTPGQLSEQKRSDTAKVLSETDKKIFAFCRTGNRSHMLWKTFQGEQRTKSKEKPEGENMSDKHTVVIIGGGSAGIATAASLLKRNSNLDIAIIEPKEEHFYQPGWTMVGGGIFSAPDTRRNMKDLMPSKAKWIKSAVDTFDPDNNAVTLSNGKSIGYDYLVVAPGLQLDFHKIEGLEATLGQNGVTSNYRYDLAPYTWELVQGLNSGTAIFTQPPMPIKCAGAPQKAMYLSANHWEKQGVLKSIDVKFCNTGGVIFGVEAFRPALMEYVKRYDAELNFGETLVKVDGPSKKAWFEKTDADGQKTTVERKFDMLHVCPPQSAPDFVKNSPLANEAGWVDVDQFTLQHNKYANIYSLGDAGSTPNAKTMAAARKQAPIVAANLMAQMKGNPDRARYDGYGACPLTVERGKIVLAEFGYGGKLLPSFPKALIPGTQATKRAWILKKSILPGIYWNDMLKGKETLAKPKMEPVTKA